MKKIKLLLLFAVASMTISAMPITTSPQVETIEQFVQNKYPGAVIVDRDKEYSNIEIEIIYKGKEIDLLFDSNGKWLKTKWDVKKSELPKAVLQAIKASLFSSYTIDDIDYFESPTSKHYKVELEKWIGDREAVLYITPEGKTL